jgi:hypothetical protein
MSAVESSELCDTLGLVTGTQNTVLTNTISVKKWLMVTFHFLAKSRYTIQCPLVIISISMTAPLI